MKPGIDLGRAGAGRTRATRGDARATDHNCDHTRNHDCNTNPNPNPNPRDMDHTVICSR